MSRRKRGSSECGNMGLAVMQVGRRERNLGMGVRRHSGVLVNIWRWRGAWLLGVAEHHREGEKECKGYSGVGDKQALLWVAREAG